MKWVGPTNSRAPQQPLKILLPDLLVKEGGFGDVGLKPWLAQILYFIDVGVFPFA